MAATYSSIAITSPIVPAQFDKRSSSPRTLSHSNWESGHHQYSKSAVDASAPSSNSARHSHSFALKNTPLNHHYSASEPTIVESGSVVDNNNGSMAKGRPRGESDLGRSATKPRSLGNGHGMSNAAYRLSDGMLPVVAEASDISLFSKYLNAFLIPAPILLGALAVQCLNSSDSSKLPSTLEDDPLNGTVNTESSKASAITLVFAITSGTLLAIGGLGHFNTTVRSEGRQRSDNAIGKASELTRTSPLSTLRRMFYRMLAVALPFLSVIELGGFRVSLLLLCLIASGLLGAEPTSGTRTGWKTLISSHKWTSVFFLLNFAIDVTWTMQGVGIDSIIRGYAALVKSTFFLPFPLPTSFPALSKLTVATANQEPSEAFRGSMDHSKEAFSSALSPLIASGDEAKLTVLSGGGLAVLTLFLYLSPSVGAKVNSFAFVLSLGATLSAAGLLYLSQPSSPRVRLDDGFFATFLLILMFGLAFESTSVLDAARFVGFTAMSYVVVFFDTKSLPLTDAQSAASTNHQHHHHHHHHHNHKHGHPPSKTSNFTQFLLRNTTNFRLVQSILLEEESRRIVYFMTINLTFMFIQTFYAFVSGSLGLLSDSIHMFFDCIGLLAGLIAAIMSKWPPNARFPYGYGKVETLSGLGNGIFLMIISVEIIWESFERFVEGAELRRLTELMLVSVGGLAVNLIGLLFIGHHHHGHDHDHGHDHSHSNENMMGIYLHILADTMGSVAVIISTILTYYTGWSGWDPIASFIIAVLIIAASYPLVTSSARRLLLTVPSEVEYAIRNTLQEISGLKGVAGYAVPRFWLDDSESSGHDHSHDYGQTHALKHKHSLDHCEHDHEHEHDHSHSHNTHTHSHSHSYTGAHAHAHSHNHDHKQHSHENGHSHSYEHNDQRDKSHSSTHSHSERQAHTHTHQHEHEHEDDHSHHLPKKLLGVIHVIAKRGHDLEEVRARVEDFLVVRNMDVVVHVEREGLGRCWCGGGVPKHGRHQSTIVMS